MLRAMSKHQIVLLHLIFLNASEQSLVHEVQCLLIGWSVLPIRITFSF